MIKLHKAACFKNKIMTFRIKGKIFFHSLDHDKTILVIKNESSEDSNKNRSRGKKKAVKKKKQKHYRRDSKEFSVELNQIDINGKTTLMIRNIPNRYNKNTILRRISKNHKGKFDFFYLIFIVDSGFARLTASIFTASNGDVVVASHESLFTFCKLTSFLGFSFS